MKQTRKSLLAHRIVDSFQREVDESRLSLRGHLVNAMREVRQLALSVGVRQIQITGRAKTRKGAMAKLLETPDASLGAIQGPLAGMDRVGIRVVVPTDPELQLILDALLPNSIYLKDYVAEPRKDGEYLGGDPKDVYRGYHIFTKQLTGIPIEIQLFTIAMRRAGIRLKRKYGTEYWKSTTFRRRRARAGDFR